MHYSKDVDRRAARYEQHSIRETVGQHPPNLAIDHGPGERHCMGALDRGMNLGGKVAAETGGSFFIPITNPRQPKTQLPLPDETENSLP